MQHRPSSHESLFVPTLPSTEVRGAPIAGFMVLMSGFALPLYLEPWADITDNLSPYLTPMEQDYSRLILLLAALTVIMGIRVMVKATRTTRWLVSLNGLLLGILGVYQIDYAHQFNAAGITMRYQSAMRSIIMSTGPGIYLLGIGVLLLLTMGMSLAQRWSLQADEGWLSN